MSTHNSRIIAQTVVFAGIALLYYHDPIAASLHHFAHYVISRIKNWDVKSFSLLGWASLAKLRLTEFFRAFAHCAISRIKRMRNLEMAILPEWMRTARPVI